MTNLLFGVTAHDPITYGAVAAPLFLVALLASYFPARRAMRVDPIVALRYEWLVSVPVFSWRTRLPLTGFLV